MLVRDTKGKYFQGNRLDRKTPKYDNDCCWIHLKLNVRAARAKLFLSLCFRVLSSFSVYGWSPPEDKISTFSIQNAKSVRHFERFLFFKRQRQAGKRGSGSHFMVVIYTETVHNLFIWQEAITFSYLMHQDFNHEQNWTSQGGGSSCPLTEMIIYPFSPSLSVFGNNTHLEHHGVGRCRFTLWFFQKTRKHCFPVGLGRLEESFGWCSN